MAILTTENLTKFFGERKALSDLSIALEEGSVYGLLGPNGAGKTTFLRLVNNILRIDSGRVLYRGEPLTRRLGRHLGYMPEERGLYSKMTLEDQILFFGRLKGGDPARLRVVMGRYMDIFGIPASDRRRKVKELSKGNQQKVQIIATLVHEPDLVMLDEPFSGFDPINGALLTQLIDDLKESGATVLLSSHNMAAVEEICSHMALINGGRLLVEGRIGDIKRRYRQDIVEVETSAPVDFSPLVERGLVASAEPVRASGDIPCAYSVRLARRDANNAVVARACESATLLGFREKLPSLSDLFIRLTSGEELPSAAGPRQEERKNDVIFEKL